MSDRKYASDYRLEDYVAPDGRLRSRRVYQGERFRFVRGQESLSKFSLALSGQVVLAAVLLLPLLVNNTQIGRTIYVILPMAFMLIPIFQLGAVCFRLRRYREPVTRQQRDLTDTRLRRCAWGLLILAAVTAVGAAVYWAVLGLMPGELPCVLGVFLCALQALAIFLQRKSAETEPCA